MVRELPVEPGAVVGADVLLESGIVVVHLEHEVLPGVGFPGVRQEQLVARFPADVFCQFAHHFRDPVFASGALHSAGALTVAALLIVVCATMRGSWDLSENRLNSFPASDEAALERIAAPLKIEAHLAPEDPRRSDLERRALSKLRRVLPDLDVAYSSESSTGLFEQAREDYGEIRYSLDGRTATSRATTVEGVLDTIYDLAGVAPASDEDEGFRGHPLNTEPYGAAQLFYLAWPAAIAAAALAHARRQS